MHEGNTFDQKAIDMRDLALLERGRIRVCQEDEERDGRCHRVAGLR